MVFVVGDVEGVGELAGEEVMVIDLSHAASEADPYSAVVAAKRDRDWINWRCKL